MVFAKLCKLLGLYGRGYDLDVMAQRLGIELRKLRDLEPSYHSFYIPKRSGGTRKILAPSDRLKKVQRRILRRLLSRLRVHRSATGFQQDESFVSNARRHEGQAVVIRFDLQDFFPSIDAKRIERYFRFIGWNRRSAKLFVRLCTTEGVLPQGAPTSPRLSNLVNYKLDARLTALAQKFGGVYSRYADDITISLTQEDRRSVQVIIKTVERIVEEEGYRLNLKKGPDVRRRHQRQRVTGLVVNQRANLSRETRRWLRAVEHRTKQVTAQAQLSIIDEGFVHCLKRPTLTASQLQGWQSLQAMVNTVQVAEEV